VTGSARPPRIARRSSRLVLIAALVASGVAITAAMWFAVRGPEDRSGAIANVLSAVASATLALTALQLSREALVRTDEQLVHTRRTIVLSRHPLLLPVHQSVSFPNSSGSLAAHPPTVERFALRPPVTGSYAFVEDVRNRFLIPVENAGEGPALQITGWLWRVDGCCGALIGPTVLGAGTLTIFTAKLNADRDILPTAFDRAVAAAGGVRRTDFFWLEMTYVDAFANPLRAEALFDPRELGAWRHVAIPAIEPGES
jgi:hypothetical protein